MKNLLVALAASFVPALIGVPFTAPGYYQRLRKPAWSPPSGLFGPVWSVLYVLIGISAWMVGRRGESGRAMGLWWTQLALNAAWTPLFFGLRNPGLALVEIVATWAAIAATVVAFFRRRPLAAALLVPYLAWVTFATALNYEIWRRN